MIKKVIKLVVPARVLRWRRQRAAKRFHEQFAQLSAAETFSEIYERNYWGGKKGEFSSGDGSTEEFADTYAKLVREIVSSKDIKSIIDLGCGDFVIASRFISDDISYTGVDIVESLIERNRSEFTDKNVDFLCLNIAEADLPDADLCIIRQVLQHLSNHEIKSVLDNCAKFKYLLISEHYPSSDQDVVPNLDIPHGPGVRTYYDSAVYLDKPPFDLAGLTLVNDFEGEGGERLKTFLIGPREHLLGVELRNGAE